MSDAAARAKRPVRIAGSYGLARLRACTETVGAIANGFRLCAARPYWTLADEITVRLLYTITCSIQK